MINFEEMKTAPIGENAANFMGVNGGSHVTLLKAWERQPEFRDDLDLLRKCLTYAVQNNQKSSAQRILGRYQKLRSQAEKAAMGRVLNPVDDCLL